MPYQCSTSVAKRFSECVNMTSEDLRAWLKTPQSRDCGYFAPGASESVGRQSAKKILRILQVGCRNRADEQHMTKVIGYIARHTAQRPKGDVRNTRWRWSLMNWGHDPYHSP